MPKLYNKKTDTPSRDAVFIGRPSEWGNPFFIGRDGTREEVIAKYEEWIKQYPWFIRAIKKHLRGKDLVCFCSPEKCHGDVLLKIANEN